MVTYEDDIHVQNLAPMARGHRMWLRGGIELSRTVVKLSVIYGRQVAFYEQALALLFV